MAEREDVLMGAISKDGIDLEDDTGLIQGQREARYFYLLRCAGARARVFRSRSYA